MLTLTDNAATQIRNLIAQPEVPDDAGVRIAGNPDGDLTLALTSAPVDGDAVLDEAGARVFLDTAAGALLEDKVLDAGADQQGNLQFSIAEAG